MAEPNERRHPNVINVSEAAERTMEKGTRFGFRGRMLASATGATGVGCTWYEVPPGRAGFPTHFHCVNEEAIYVLEGEGALRIGSQTVTVRAGDYATLPTGPESAHKLTNTGTAPLRYLCLSTMHKGGEVVGYPDSNKIGAMGFSPTWKFPEKAWVRVLTRADASLDYYDGEDVG